jgi:signal transduction histidine kinase
MRARLSSLLERRYRISTQLYLAIGGAVVLTVAASLVGWFSFSRVDEAQSRVNESSVPELVAAFGVAQHSGTLVVAAPRLTTAATPKELAAVSQDITKAHEALQAAMKVLGQQGGEGEVFNRIQADADTLILNIRAIEAEKSQIFDLSSQSGALRAELGELRTRLDGTLVPAVDDQLFYTMTGYRYPGQEQTGREEYFSEEELWRYRRLADLQADASNAVHLLESAFSVSEAPHLEPLKERFESSAGHIEQSLASLENSPLRSAVAPALDRLIEVGIGNQGGFDLLDQELRLVENQSDLLAQNSDISVNLIAVVDGLVSQAHANAQEATRASTEAVWIGRVLLLAITAVSIGGALLIAWLFVGRVLLRRLEMLADWMRRMAGGDLEVQVEIGGRDEVADMAAALEVFRQHALEVQRLNLVEELAQELEGKNVELESLAGELQGKNVELESLTDEMSGKNEELEQTLADLNRAQDQIVMREKLAALGELTAGVAHEIRNPLNFVKNFSEVSSELLTELREVLDEDGNNMSEDQRGLVQDISNDISSNLERIGSHTARANRIVHDMLMMGRGSAERASTNINSLVDEYSRLAFHSARAVDPNFQLDIQQDLDPDTGELEAIPQDLGRVFLNMVGNACYATDEKRRGLGGAGASGDPYWPTVWVSTKREEDQIVVRIKDNGNGMPPEVVEKIFNPFFTTKPTGEGTGLGLAISSDIVREHGGTISVDTQPGEFTEMIVELPLEPPVQVVAPVND